MELMFALSSCAIMLHTMGMRYLVLVTFIWNTDIESVQEIKPIRRDVGIVGGTHSYDWWLVNGTGVHGS